MPLYLQHILVLTVVAGCAAYTGYQSIRSLRGKKSRLGSCCAKGCEAQKPGAASAEKVHFLPAEMLGRKR